MGNRLTTFQNLLDNQLRTMQSIVVHLVRIEEILGDIRDGRVMALPETRRLRRRSRGDLPTVNEGIVLEDDETITGSSDNNSDDSIVEEAIV